MFDLMLYLVLMFIFVLGLDVLVFVVYVYFVCCDVWIEYCVEGIVFVIGLWDCVSVDVVICNVQDIVGICLVVSLIELMVGFVLDGLLFDQVCVWLFECMMVLQKLINYCVVLVVL